MSNLDLRKFVDVNIKYHAASSASSIRDTVALFSTESLPSFSSNRPERYAERYDTFASVNEWDEYVTNSNLNVTPSGAGYNTDTYIRVFFANGGAKVKVLTGTFTTAQELGGAIKALKNEIMLVAYTGNESIIREVAATRASDTTIRGINEKILLGRVITSSSASSINIQKYVVKCSNVLGCEMTIAAYLTSINIYGSNTVQDYAFTREYDFRHRDGSIEKIAEEASDELYEDCLTNNLNVIMNVANADRNLGGNLTDGRDLTNEYVLIALHQTVTDRLVSLLTQKLKGSSGISAIHAVIDDELSKYLTNGYLTTDEVWKDRDLTIDYNGQTYTIISTGDALLMGYKVTILPYNSLSDEDAAKRMTPPIYIVLADSYGIRAIKIDGEII